VKFAVFHPEADEEFAAAIAYYAGQAKALGERFYEEMRRLTAEIENAPGRYKLWRHGARRHFGDAFPYAIIYVERPAHITVAAVAHFKRAPDYWRGRLG